MILVISTCENKFHELEFVRPITDIIKKQEYKYEVCHYKKLTQDKIDSSDRIIICGTALKDNEYLNHLENFKWIKEYKNHLMGICSGSQIICTIFGAPNKEKIEIGLTKDIEIQKRDKILDRANLNEIYSLHNMYNDCPQDFVVIANNEIPQMVKKDNIYAILFHPEIRNKEIIVNFCKMKNENNNF